MFNAYLIFRCVNKDLCNDHAVTQRQTFGKFVIRGDGFDIDSLFDEEDEDISQRAIAQVATCPNKKGIIIAWL